MELEDLRTFEADDDREMLRFENRLEVRERVDVEMTDGFRRSPLAGGAGWKRMLAARREESVM